jgi:hypothetical protein
VTRGSPHGQLADLTKNSSRACSRSRKFVKKERTYILVGVLLLQAMCSYYHEIKSRAADHCQNPNAIISSPHNHHNQQDTR